MNFTFDGNMDREVIESYLSRAVTAAGLYDSHELDDDLRVIREAGVKFLGRASGIWYMFEPDEVHFEKSRRLAERVHAQDPEVILQACVFEWIVKRIEEVEIPAYVFTAFGKPVEKRCFRFEDTIYPEGHHVSEREDPGKHGTIPDLSRDEARMWFYYRATRYIDCGYEALHMGQVHLYTCNDRGMKKTYELFDMIRAYAAEHGRRHKVLMDAHTHGVSVNGRLLFDYHAMPFTRMPLPDEEGEKLVLVREGFSEGGDNPNGFSADVMPYLMEYDNWGGLVVEGRDTIPHGKLAYMDWWGYDQIAWFANQSKEDRDHFMEYTWKWIQINNPNGYFEFPFRRMLGDAPVTQANGIVAHDYRINDLSDACPTGFGQEAVMKKCWAMGDRLRREYANPRHLIRYGARDEFDSETGMKLPEKIVVYGSFQPYVGGNWCDSNCELTRMYYIGDNTYTLSVVLPYAGTYDYGISTYGTFSACYTKDRFATSGSGSRVPFTVKKDNSVVKFTYRFIDNIVTVDICED